MSCNMLVQLVDPRQPRFAATLLSQWIAGGLRTSCAVVRAARLSISSGSTLDMHRHPDGDGAASYAPAFPARISCRPVIAEPAPMADVRGGRSWSSTLRHRFVSAGRSRHRAAGRGLLLRLDRDHVVDGVPDRAMGHFRGADPLDAGADPGRFEQN